MIKALSINKFASSYKDNVLSQEPHLLNTATNTARANWKMKYPSEQLPKVQNLTLSPITAAIKGFLNVLHQGRMHLAIKNKRNQNFIIY